MRRKVITVTTAQKKEQKEQKNSKSESVQPKESSLVQQQHYHPLDLEVDLDAEIRSEEENHAIWQIHKEILSHKPGEAVTSKLFQKTVLPNFRLAMFTAYRQLEDEKDRLFQQQITPCPPSKKVRKVAKEEEKEEEKK